MRTVGRTVCENVRDRPFDFYVAFLLFIAGLFALFSDSWPESMNDMAVIVMINVISVYYVIAGAVIMLSLGCNRRKHPVVALTGEMYGWMGIAAASIATVIMYIWAAFVHNPQSLVVWILMVCIWTGMGAASTVRFLDLRLVYRGLHK